MNKINKAEKRLTICIPEELCDKFQNACDANYKSMSEALRDFIKSYIADYMATKMIGTGDKVYVVSVQDNKGDLHELEVFSDLSVALEFDKKMNAIYAQNDWQTGFGEYKLNTITQTLSTKIKEGK